MFWIETFNLDGRSSKAQQRLDQRKDSDIKKGQRHMEARPMRRKKLEIKDPQQIRAILEAGEVCHLAMHDEPYPYLVVMNYAVDYSEDKIRLLFHCAKEGKKLDLIAKNPNVCFEIHTAEELEYNPDRKMCTMFSKSITGFGQMRIAKPREKRAILDAIMVHYYGRLMPYSDSAISKTCCLVLEVDSLTGKDKNPNAALKMPIPPQAVQEDEIEVVENTIE